MAPRLRQLIILLTVGVSFGYLLYRALFTLNTNSTPGLILSIALLCAETFGICSVFLFALQVWDPREPAMQPVLPGRTVDVFVPTYNEDPMILRATLEACMRLEYPGRRVYLCDDGGTEQRLNHPENGPKARARADELKALCAELGVTYLTRPKNEHAKAGNLNHAFTETDGEFIIIFDADHVPEPHFISRIIGYFADEKLGYIQTPHAFYNFNSFQARLDHANRRYWEEGALFYGMIQPGRNRWNCPIFAGSAAMFRRKALEEVGYIALETITEDMHTGMRMNAKGWKSLGVSERMVAGQAAPDITTFHTQRLRWGEGNLSIMAYDNPLTMKGLTLAQRFCYFGSMMHWAGGLFKLIIYCVPIVMMVTGISPVKEFNWTLFGITAVYMFMSLYGVRAMSGGYGSIVYGELFAMVNFWTQIRGLSRAIFWRKFQQFVVTSKRGRQSNSVWPFIRPQAILFAASFLALAWGWARIAYGISDDFYKPIIPTVWLVFHMMLASMAIRRSMWPDDGRFSFRHSVNVACRYESADGQVGYGVTIDLNEMGCGMVGFRPVARGEVLTVEVEGAGEIVRTKATVRWIAAVAKGKLRARGSNPVGVPQAYRIGVRFDPLPGPVFDAINRITLQYGVPRLYQEYAEGNKQHPLRLLVRRVMRPFGSGRVDPRRGYKLPMQVRANGGAAWTVTEDLSPTAVAALLPAQLPPNSDVEVTMLSPVGEVSGTAKVMRTTRGVIGAKEYWRTVLEFRHLVGDGPNTVQNLISRQAFRVMHDALVPDPKPLPIPTVKPATYSALTATAILGGLLVAFPLVYRDELFLREVTSTDTKKIEDEGDIARIKEIIAKTERQGYPSNDRLVLLAKAARMADLRDAEEVLVAQIAQRDPRNEKLQKALVQIQTKRGNYAQAEATYKRLLERQQTESLGEAEKQELLLAGARVSAGSKDFAEATKRFKEYLDKFPNDLPARNEYAGMLIDAGKQAEVAAVYDKQALTHAAHPPTKDSEDKPIDPVYDARLLLMSSYAMDRNEKRAEEQADFIRQLRPNDEVANEVIANIRAAAGELEGARQAYEKQIAQNLAEGKTPKPQLRESLGRVYAASGNAAGAAKALEQYQLAYEGTVKDSKGVARPYRSQELSRGIIDAAAGLDADAFKAMPRNTRDTIIEIEQAADPTPLGKDPTFVTRAAYVMDRLGKADRAAILVERAAGMKPDDPDIQKQLFGILVAQGKVDEAMRKLSRSKETPEVRQLLVDAYLKVGDMARAEEEAAALTKLKPDDLAAKAQLADITSWNKRPGPAAALFRQIIPNAPSTPYPPNSAKEEQQPLNQYAERRLAECLLWAKEHAAALAQYEALLTRPREGVADPFLSQPRLWSGYVDAAAAVVGAVGPKAPVPLTEQQAGLVRRLALQPANADSANASLQTRLGWVLTRSGQFDLAVPLLNKAAATVSDSKDEKDVPLRRELAGVLAATQDKSFAQTAVRLYDAIPEEKRAAADFERLTNIYASLKQWKQAETQAQNFVKASPGNLEAERLYADVLNWSEQYKEALARYKALQKFEPTNPQLALRVAQVTSRMGKYAEAVDLFSPLLDRKFDEAPEALEGFVEAAGAADDLSAAQKETLVRVISSGQFKPDDAAKLGRLAWAAHKVGLEKEANDAAARAVALNPTDDAVKKQLGGTLAALKKFDLALKLFAPVALKSDDAADKLRLADIYSSTDDFARAEQTVADYLKTKPNDLRAKVKLADVKGYGGKHAEALKLYDEVRKDPNAAKELKPAELDELPIKVAEVTTWAGSPVEALKMLDAALKSRDTNPRAWGPYIDAAAAAMAQGDLTKAQKDTVLAVGRRVDPAKWDNAGRLARLGALLQKLGRPEEGRKALARASELVEQPAQAAVNTKAQLGARRELAFALSAAGDPKGALQLFDSVITKTPDDRHAIASLHLAAGDADAAEAEVRALLAEVPNDPRAERLLAEVLFMKKDGAGALAVLDKLLKGNGSSPEVALRAAGIALELKQPASALDRFAEVLKLQPDNADARRGFVDAAGLVETLTPEQFELAQKLAADQGAARPGRIDGKEAVSLGRLAWVMIRADRKDLADKLLDRVEANQPGDIKERRELAGTFAAAGRAKTAFALFGAAPTTPEERRQYANLLGAAGDWEKAVAELRVYLQATPDDALARRQLADNLSWNRDFDESLVLLEDLARANPNDVKLAFRVAETTLWAGRADEALALFAALAAADPKNEKASDGVVSAALQSAGLPAAAAATLQRVRADLLPARAGLIRAAQAPAAAPPNPVRMARLAAALVKHGKADAAAALLDAAAAAPSVPATRREVAALLDVAGRPDDAKKLFDGAPETAPALLAQAKVYLTARQFPKAAAAARAALAAKPKDADAARALADALAYAEATRAQGASEFRTLLSQKPGDAELTVRLAQTLADEGQPEEAIGLLRERLKREPARVKLAKPLLETVVGTKDLGPNDTTLLAQTLQDAPLLLQVRGSLYLADLGRTLAALGRPGEANRALDDAVRTLPPDAGTRQAVALALASAGRSQQALEMLSDPAAGAVSTPVLVYLYTQRQNWPEAEKLARANFEKQKDRAAKRLLADVLAWSKKDAEALKLFAELAAEDPKDKEIPLRVAQTKLWGGDPAGALPEFTRLLTADFERTEAYDDFLAAAVRSGTMTQEVLDLARKVADRRDPATMGDAAALARLARVEEALGRKERAEAALTKAAPLVTNTTDPGARREVAGALAAIGRVPDARALMNAVKEPSFDDKRLVAGLLAAERKWPEAEAAVRALQKEKPDDVGLKLQLADVLLGKKDVAAALPLLKGLLAARPGDFDVMLRLGNAYILMEEPELATEMYSKALARQPRNPRARQGFVDAASVARYMRMDEIRLVMMLLGDPELPKSTNVEYLSRLAWVAIREGVDGPIKAMHDRALELAPPDVAVRREIAGSLASAGRGAEAIKLFGALEAKTDEDHYELANIYAALKQFNPAVREAKLYVRAKPNDYKARRLLADLHSYNRDFDEALDEFEKLRRDYPADKSIPVRIAECTLWSHRPNVASLMMSAVLNADPDLHLAVPGFVASAFEAYTIFPETLAAANKVRPILTASLEEVLAPGAVLGGSDVGVMIFDDTEPLLLARLAYVFHQAGEKEIADRLFNRAIAATMVNDFRARTVVGTVLELSGRADDAGRLLTNVPFNADDRYEAALAYAGVKAYRRAIEVLRGTVEKEPSHRRSERLLADCLTWDKQYDEGLAILRKLLREDPADIDLPPRIAQTLVWMGRAEEAARMYLEMYRREPGSAKYYRGLIESVFYLNPVPDDIADEMKRAYRDYEFLRRVPEAEYNAKLGKIFLTLGMPPEGNKHLDTGVANLPDRAIIAREEVAKALAAAGRTEQAIALYDREPRLAPDQLRVAFLYGDAAKWSDAERAVRAFLKTAPDDEEANRYLADVLAASGQFNAALELLGKMIEKLPKDGRLRMRLAEITLDSRQPEKALGLFEALLQERAGNVAARNGYLTAASRALSLTAAQKEYAGKLLGGFDLKGEKNPAMLARVARLLGRLNRRADALAALDLALKFKALSPDARRELALALSYFGRADEALALYQGVKPAGDDRGVMSELYRATQNWAEAERLVREMLAEKPDDVALLRQLAEVLAGKGDHDGALAIFEKLRAASPDDLELAVRTADAYLAAGQPAKALPVFAAALAKEWQFAPARLGFTNAAAAVQRLTRDQIALAAKLAADPATKESDDAVYLARLGWALIRDGQPKGAAALLERAVALKPADPAVRRELAGVLASAGRGKQALELFGGAAKTPEDRLRLANIYAALHDWGAALREVDAFIQAKPDDARGPRLRADLLSWGGRHDDAIALFETFLAANPNDSDAAYRLAETMLWSGRAADALERLTKLLALDNPPKGLLETFVAAAFEVTPLPPPTVKALEGLSDRADALKANPLRLAQFGLLLGRAGKKDQSNELLTQAAATVPDADAGLRREVAAVLTLAGRSMDAAELTRDLPDDPADHLRAAAVYQAARAYPPAIAALRRALAQQPDSFEIQRRLVDALAGAQQWEDARTLLRKLLAEEPDNRALQVRLAEVLLYKGDAYGEAIRAFEGILAAAPDDARAAAGFLFAAGELGRLTPAERDRVLKLYKAAEPTLNARPALALARFGRAALAAGLTNEAAELFRRAAAAAPRSNEGRRELASLLSTAGRFDDALRLLDGLPDDPDSATQRVYVYVGMKDWDKAVAAAQAIRDARPGDPKPAKLLADVYVWAGRHTEALALLADLIKADPSDRTLRLRAAQARLWSRDAAGAAEAFAAVLANDPDNSDAKDGFAAALATLAALPEPPPPAYVDLAEKLAKPLTGDQLDANPFRAARLGAALRRLNRPVPAEFAERAVGIAPRSDDERRELVGLLAALGRANEAMALFKQVTPRDAAERDSLAWLFLAANNPDAAERVARETVLARPNDPAAVRLLGDLLAARKNFGEAAQQYQRLLALLPEDPKVQALLGTMLLANSDYLGAAGKFEPLAAKNPAAVKEFGAPLMAALANLEREKITREMEATAFRVAETPEAKKSDSIPFVTDTAWVLDKLGKRPAGEEYLARALALNPVKPEDRKNLSGVLEVFGRADEAVKMLMGLTLTEGDRFRLAGLNAAMGKYDEAEVEVRAILVNAPNNLEAKRLLADVLSWNSKNEKTGYQESLDLFAELMRAGYVDPRKPPRPSLPVRIAQCLLWAKKYDLAAERFRALLEGNFEQPLLWPSYIDAASSATTRPAVDGQLASRIYERVFLDKVAPKALYADVQTADYPLVFLSRLAWVLQLHGKKDYVKALLDGALLREPANDRERRELAGVLASVGRYTDARRLYAGIDESLLEFNDFVNLAQVDNATNLFDAAERRIRAALRRPNLANNVQLQLMLADALVYQQKYDAAFEVLVPLRGRAGLTPAENRAANAKLAMALVYQGNPASVRQAMDWFVKSLTAAPEEKELWQPFLDAVSLTPNPPADARRLADTIVTKMEALAVDNPELYASIAGALTRVGRGTKALDAIERALLLRPESVALRRRYADTLSLLGRSAEAERQYRIALDMIERSKAPAALRTPQVILPAGVGLGRP